MKSATVLSHHLLALRGLTGRPGSVMAGTAAFPSSRTVCTVLPLRSFQPSQTFLLPTGSVRMLSTVDAAWKSKSTRKSSPHGKNVPPRARTSDAVKKPVATYVGEKLNGKFHGKGVLHTVEGGIYEGEFQNGKRHGKGTYTLNGKELMSGDWQQGVLWGTGRAELADGSIYEGEFKEGRHHGRGKMSNMKNVASFEGEWTEGERGSLGKVTYHSGDTYVGELGKDLRRQGEGTYTWVDGSVYGGGWAYGKHSGEGTLRHADGTALSGLWKNGRVVRGSGTMKMGLGTFTGSWVDGRTEGPGRYVYPTGEVFEGVYRAGRIWEGKGAVIDKAGNKQEGVWREGKRVESA